MKSQSDRSHGCEVWNGGTTRIWCCDCGTELVCCDPDATTKLALCSGCWTRLPAAVIVERSKAHNRMVVRRIRKLIEEATK